MHFSPLLFTLRMLCNGGAAVSGTNRRAPGMGVASDIGIDISLGHQGSSLGNLFGDVQQGWWRSFESSIIIIPLACGVAVVPMCEAACPDALC